MCVQGGARNIERSAAFPQGKNPLRAQIPTCSLPLGRFKSNQKGSFLGRTRIDRWDRLNKLCDVQGAGEILEVPQAVDRDIMLDMVCTFQQNKSIVLTTRAAEERAYHTKDA